MTENISNTYVNLQNTTENLPKIEEKKEEVKEINIKLNIRKKLIKASIYKRAKKAVKLIREFIIKQTKNKNVKISKRLNEYIWSRGIKNPPSKYNLRIIKKGDTIYVDLK